MVVSSIELFFGWLVLWWFGLLCPVGFADLLAIFVPSGPDQVQVTGSEREKIFRARKVRDELERRADKPSDFVTECDGIRSLVGISGQDEPSPGGAGLLQSGLCSGVGAA
jgi:hypothetical protein